MRIGIDLLAHKRITLSTSLAHKILSPSELTTWLAFKTKTRKREFLAGRWCLKEAVTKTLALDQVVPFSRLEIKLHPQSGLTVNVVTPQQQGLQGNDLRSEHWSLSLTHDRKYSFAIAIRQSPPVKN